MNTSSLNGVERLKELYEKAHALLNTDNPITIPNYNSITFPKAKEIIDAIDAKDFRKSQALVMAHAFDLRNRASRLTYFYRSCSRCSELLRVLEAATLSLFRDNYIATFFTLMPLIECLLLRWMGHNAKDPKPKFPQIKMFLARKIAAIRPSIPNWNASDNLKTIVSYQMEHIENVINSHLFENHLERISDLNRHLALHLIEIPNFCNSLNAAQLFIILDNLIDVILWDEGKYGDAWSDQFSGTERETRRMYEMAFQATRIQPAGYFRFANDINTQNHDYYSRWVLQYLDFI